MGQMGKDVVNWTTFGQTRALIGGEFSKILGYYRDDAAENVVAVEQAYKLRDAVSMVRPAHTLKGDSLQFGGEALASWPSSSNIARAAASKSRAPPIRSTPKSCSCARCSSRRSPSSSAN